jgi:ribosomal protein S18 acetylase RimI-like enzyme
VLIYTSENIPVELKRLDAQDFSGLEEYFVSLTAKTKSRFGPHPFDKDNIALVYAHQHEYRGYVAVEKETGKIIAYAIVKNGYLEHDFPRLYAYGIEPDNFKDCTYAPSVADSWQGKGLGFHLFRFILSDLKTDGIHRILLWGGVQSSNLKAVEFYRRNGFYILGSFEHNGENYDMLFDITE